MTLILGLTLGEGNKMATILDFLKFYSKNI